MKPSEFYSLVALIYLAPQLSMPVGGVASACFAALALLMLAANK